MFLEINAASDIPVPVRLPDAEESFCALTCVPGPIISIAATINGGIIRVSFISIMFILWVYPTLYKHKRLFRP
jgi:hypothetical protein